MRAPRRHLAGLGAVFLLAACGADPAPVTGSDEVDTLVTGTPAATTAAPASQERPLLRPDASQDEEDRLYDVYWTCLTDHGVPGYKTSNDSAAAPGEPAAAPGGRGEDDPAALAACAHLEPEEPWQRAQRTDPHYTDKLRDWITCVRSHGIDAFENDGFLAFESLPPENEMKLVDECQMKAFS